MWKQLVDYVSTAILTNIFAQVKTRLTMGLFGLKENVNTGLYRYMRVLASHLVNPVIVAMDNLKTNLVLVKMDTKSNPRLELLEEPDKITDLSIL